MTMQTGWELPRYIDDDDPLTVCEVSETTEAINPALLLRAAGIPAEELWYASGERRTSHFSRRVIINSAAGNGEISRMEIYANRRKPGRCFYVVYREELQQDGSRLVINQFFTNDPEYARRHEWMELREETAREIECALRQTP